MASRSEATQPTLISVWPTFATVLGYHGLADILQDGARSKAYKQ